MHIGLNINDRRFYTTILLIMFTFTVLLAGYSHADEKKEAEDPKKKELQELMKKIDKHYKAAQERMGYYYLSDSDWATLLKTGEVISKLSGRVLEEFIPPDDEKYLQLTKEMKRRADEIHKSATEKYLGAYEDIQYSFGRLRNCCKNCHNHLGIQIYTSLYPGETSSKVK
ncbi:MAG: hypothetical protein ACE5IC_02850 [Candidatus Brocadiales bacterium]